MKILLITNMYPVPDYIYFGIHVKEQIDALKKDKDVHADIYFINGREKKVNYLNSISDIKEKVSSGGYDLIHIHYGISGLFLHFYKPDVPVVITLHSGELFQKKGYINHLMQKKLTLSIIKKVDKIIVLNDDMVDLLKKHKEKLIKLPCGTNLEMFSGNGGHKSANSILIGFPGNKSRKEKNYELFSDIVDKLKETYKIEVIEFHNLTREQVVENLRQIDLLLMTSKVEGSPQIIKEAMGCNKPIVSTCVGDVKDLLDGVKNTNVIDSFDAEAFVSPIKKIINLPISERYSNGKDKLVSMGLDSESVSERLYSIYEELV